MAFQGFGKSNGPSVPPRSQPIFGHFPRSPSQSFPDWGPRQLSRSVASPFETEEVQKLPLEGNNCQTHQWPSTVSPHVASHNSSANFPLKGNQFQDLKGTTSPPLLFSDGNNLRNSSCSIASTTRLNDSPSGWVERRKVSFKDINAPNQQMPFVGAPYVVSPVSESKTSNKANFQGVHQTKSQALLSGDRDNTRQFNFNQDVSSRTSMHRPRFGIDSKVLHQTSGFQFYGESSASLDAEPPTSKSPTLFITKRTRSPPVRKADRVSEGASSSIQDDTEREMQAKAKRLVRFRDELSHTMSGNSDTSREKLSENKHNQLIVERRKCAAKHPSEAAEGFSNESILAEYEGFDSLKIIVGLCQDMCPELERAERERKGDLDQHERLEGDRNQTNALLAVKKYNRTAEREAELIRPMPVLQRTIDYLLALLDQPYDERFLGVYNFLWDRMRAIRMDLRMQHIFNFGAITMLEQMIKLHIVAMHEFCEYTKGEGFSEGFDAHLNIEQMNKTSVDLFQMYDDHRKKGIYMLTEKEFRGYYALLKLDKHPGYKVEPAELSLDLAKMTPEIRQTPDVLFARNVARACRTGNFIAFFRLARKASYLQACLMHAHFAKLRTLAFASLHNGLQNNQGLPVALVAKWLGMEGEDIKSLLNYHGFLIKEFEEPYMVKCGQFLNGDKDYPTKCSRLVYLKKSKRIIEDVLSRPSVSSPVEKAGEHHLGKVSKDDLTVDQLVEVKKAVNMGEEEMPDFLTVSSPKYAMRVEPFLRTSILGKHTHDGDGHQMGDVSHSSREVSFPHATSVVWPRTTERELSHTIPGAILNKVPSDVKALPSCLASTNHLHDRFSFPESNSAMEISPLQNAEGQSCIHPQSGAHEISSSCYDEEVAVAKLKMFIRLWRRRAAKLRDLREQRLVAANAALSSLSLGPPIQQKNDVLSSIGGFDIDHAMRERHEKHIRSWSRMNVSDVMGAPLRRRNPNSRCLCCKVIVCSQTSNARDSSANGSRAGVPEASSWLLSKIMPTIKENDYDENLILSSPSVSIWKKWISDEPADNLTCCFSIIKDVNIDDRDDPELGASGVVFVLSESIPWEVQKIKLHRLLLTLPPDSHLPLLILSGSCMGELSFPSSTIADDLGLIGIDKSRICSFSIVCLVENQEQFGSYFSDEQLRQGLEWLASESPRQPVVHGVKARELIFSHLNHELQLLDKMLVYEVSPNDCISAFNKALDRSSADVLEAAASNPSGWPCPEIEDYIPTELCLPSNGWSLASNIEPVLLALRDCKLPDFTDDLAWLRTGSNTSDEIRNQRSRLDNCLVRYLSESSKMMGLTQATKEACTMLENNAGLELRGSSFYIVPRWMGIFHRIINWRLMSLPGGRFPYLYTREQDIIARSTWAEMGAPLSHLNYPSLDEMIELGCGTLLSWEGMREKSSIPPVRAEISELGHKRDALEGGTLAETGGEINLSCNLNNGGSSDLIAAHVVENEADSLSELLDHCNLLQDMIDKKLSIYF